MAQIGSSGVNGSEFPLPLPRLSRCGSRAGYTYANERCCIVSSQALSKCASSTMRRR